MRDLDSIKSDMKSAMRRQSSISLEDLAVEFEEHGTTDALAWANNARGTAAIRRGDNAEALLQFERALGFFQCLPPDKNDEASVLSNIAMVHTRMGDYAKALEVFHRSLQGHLSRGAGENAANVTMNIGGIHYYQAEYPLALEFFERALSLYEKNGIVGGIASSLGNIGSVYTMAGDLAKGLEYFHRQIDLYEQNNMTSILHEPLVNVATTHMRAKEFDTSLTLLHQALDIAVEHNERHAEQHIAHSIGDTLAARSSHADAVPWFRRALDVARSIDAAAGIAQSMIGLISALYHSGEVDEARQLLDDHDDIMKPYPVPGTYRKVVRSLLLRDVGAVDEAHALLTEALQEATDRNLRSEMVDITKDLRELAHHMRDLDLYVEYNERYQRLADELHGAEATRRLGLQQKDREIALERARIQKQLDVLYAALPEHIAQRVSRGEVVHDHHDNAAVIFLDIVGFTTLSSQLDASGVVLFLESIFRELDAICERHNITPIKTIGDSYMAVAFEEQPNSRTTEQPNGRITEQPSFGCELRAANAALDILSAISRMVSPLSSPEGSPEGSPGGSPEGSPLQVRIGMNSGPVTAGVLGTKRLQFDVWGDTVNVASRLESSGESGKIQMSEAFATSLAPGAWNVALRGEIELKGKGRMTTYWLEANT
ncbi:MAG: hypothetical protein EHM43_06095 [Ignavibacteriae bacterium]|nr:MAG: hypothetical protein EHM43_06095 [Ignavibacteriota bacterium]